MHVYRGQRHCLNSLNFELRIWQSVSGTSDSFNMITSWVCVSMFGVVWDSCWCFVFHVKHIHLYRWIFCKQCSIWKFLACSSLATWHWGLTCASILFNNGLDSMSHTRLFILNLILAIFGIYLQLICMYSSPPWSVSHKNTNHVGTTRVWKLLFLCFFCLIGRWGCERSSSLDGSFPRCKIDCNKKVFFCDIISIYFYGWSNAFYIDVFVIDFSTVFKDIFVT